MTVKAVGLNSTSSCMIHDFIYREIMCHYYVISGNNRCFDKLSEYIKAGLLKLKKAMMLARLAVPAFVTIHNVVNLI